MNLLPIYECSDNLLSVMMIGTWYMFVVNKCGYTFNVCLFLSYFYAVRFLYKRVQCLYI